MKKMLMNVVVSLFILAAFLGASEPQKVQVVPQGELQAKDLAAEISISFDQAMVALGATPKDFIPDFLLLTPAVKGRFYWANDRVLMFHPESRLPYATAFTLTVKKTTRTLSGAVLGRDLVFRFQTPTPALVRAYPVESRERGRIWMKDHLRVFFNQPISVQEVESKLKLVIRPSLFQYSTNYATTSPEALAKIQRVNSALQAKEGKLQEIAVKVIEERQEGIEFIIQPVGDIPLNASVHMTVPAGFRGKEGPEPARKESALDFSTPKTFLYGGISCTTCPSDYYSTQISFTNRVNPSTLEQNLKLYDISGPEPVILQQLRQEGGELYLEGYYEYDPPHNFLCALNSLYRLQPERRYRLELLPGLEDTLGLALGIRVQDEFTILPHPADMQLINSQGIIESGGPAYFSLRVMNVDSASYTLKTLGDEEIPLFLFADPKPEGGTLVKSGTLRFKAKRNASTVANVNVEKSLGAKEGIVYAAFEVKGIKSGVPEAENNRCEGVLQITDLALSLKYSSQDILVYLTSLASGKPIADGEIKVMDHEGKVAWQGRSDGQGLCRAPGLEAIGLQKVIRGEANFVVLARKGSDRAFVSSSWCDGIESWSFNFYWDERQQAADSMGFLFTDRGAYRPGEEVFVKGMFRLDRGSTLRLPPAGKVRIKVLDGRDQEIHKGSYATNGFGSISFSFSLPAEVPTGYCRIQAETPEGWTKQASTFERSILVAEFRKPDFRVDVTAKRANCYPGQSAEGTVKGAYLFGAPMKECRLRWTLRASPEYYEPKLQGDQASVEYQFYDPFLEQDSYGSRVLAEGQGSLDAKGEFPVAQPLDFDRLPRLLSLEAEVTDTTQQAISGRTSMMLHPSEVYIGLRRGDYFVQKGKSIDSALIAARVDGTPVPNLKVKVELIRREWHSVQEKQEGGYYRYRSEVVDKVVQTTQLTTASKPVPISFTLDQPGYYILRSSHRDGLGHDIGSALDLYGVGEGFIPWERFDHQRMDLVPERATYSPGQKARILVKSPWTEAQGIVTIERAGILDAYPVALKGSTQVIEVPIKSEYIPTVYVSVLLVRGRTADKLEEGVDVGKPTFRLGYTKLDITPEQVYLKVNLSSDREEYRPRETVKLSLQVRDFSSKPKAAEVTLYAVDYGILSLTGYRVPDPVSYFYRERPLGVNNATSYISLISRDYLKGKLAEEAGGGGLGDMFEVRKDFRVTPFWKGELVTDAKGEAAASFTLPDFLTTFVVMAVAQTQDSTFGSVQKEIRVSKPIMLFPSFPRFLLEKDRCQAALRIQNNTPLAGQVTLRADSQSHLLEIEGGEQSLQLEPQGSALVQFSLKAIKAGSEKIRVYATFTAGERQEKDAVEVSLPVTIPKSRVDAATWGSTDAQETLAILVPPSSDPGVGGLRVSLSSSALSQLEGSTRFLFDYPYGCTEQLASTLVPFLAQKSLAKSFSLMNYTEKQIDGIVREALAKLYPNQRANGGFGIWPDSREPSPYVSAYVLSLFKMAENRGFAVSKDARERLVGYLKGIFRTPISRSTGDFCTRAFISYALSLYSQGDSSSLSLLFEKREGMPLFARAFLLQAAVKTKASSVIVDALRRELHNAARLSGSQAHFEEGYFNGSQVLMHSDLRTNAIILQVLLETTPDSPLIEKLVAHILGKRKNGAWRNTQENSYALISLSEYFRLREAAKEVDFTANVQLGDRSLPPVTFREARQQVLELAMAEIQKMDPGKELPLRLAKEGKGRLFYGATLTSAPLEVSFQDTVQGFSIRRSYEDAKTGQKKNSFQKGDLVRVRLALNVTAERVFVALTDPIPAGMEIENSSLQTTSQENLLRQGESSWYFYHVEPYDNRIQAFADTLPQGNHEFVYVIRATTSGSFLVPAAKVEEMYNPEVYGLSKGDRVTIE